MIQIQQLGVHFGADVLFEDVTINLYPGHRYGIVGANGSGKSTFLQILAQEREASTGKVVIPKDLSLGVLKQNHYEYEQNRVLDVVLMGRRRLWAALEEKNQILARGNITAEEGMRLAELEIQIADEDGYEAEAEASTILSGLGLVQTAQGRAMSQLSGGYKLRVLLAQCLFSRPDALFLDEPTNHLDIDSIAWLERYLLDYRGILGVISHDTNLLTNLSTDILDVDYEEIRRYSGNYTAFALAKHSDVEQKQKEIAQQEKKKEELERFVARFSAKATKARQANSRKKIIEKMEVGRIKRSSRIAPNFAFVCKRPSGKEVLEIEGLSKSYGDKRVIHNLNLTLLRGKKLAVIGPNGVGKSTLLKILTENETADAGSFTWGYETHIGYCPQNHYDIIPKESTPYEYLYDTAPGETIGTIRGVLGRMLFSGDEVHKSTSVLSGGERARLLFAVLMQGKGNVLVLDEPSNHLDLETIQALVQALQRYEGSIIFVSHDRYLIEKVCDAVIEIRENGATYYPGGYPEYLEAKQIEDLERQALAGKAATNAQTPLSPQSEKSQPGKAKLGESTQKKRRTLKKQIESSERKIATLEQRKADLQHQMSTQSDAALLEDLQQQDQSLEQELTELVEHWSLLGEQWSAISRQHRG